MIAVLLAILIVLGLITFEIYCYGEDTCKHLDRLTELVEKMTIGVDINRIERIEQNIVALYDGEIEHAAYLGPTEDFELGKEEEPIR